MSVAPTPIAEVLVLEPEVRGDERGFFVETWNARTFASAAGLERSFVQDNHSRSARMVLRGIHYQIEQAQGKLLRVVSGRVFDVAVDLRRSSPTFGRWVGVELTATNHRQLWVPEGFGHGFVVLSESADLLYKTTDYYAPEHERTLAWDDPDVGIDWPLEGGQPILSAKDRAGHLLASADLFP
ncbi:MAG TPA: dTDP-4-dehydrorhamnose 3,5-epimerase [Acidimicrobiia bacterium]|nr:dTDP-4-dehydrorhamnose 3,5-epimerase [Acidimicrobiia bacterium]